MSEPAAPAAPAALIEGEAAWLAALDAWMDEASARGAATLWWCDADYLRWPIGQRAWIERLERWVGPGRELVVLVGQGERMMRAHPRWAAWRRTWSHRVSLWSLDGDDAHDLPSVALRPAGRGLERLGGEPVRARWLREPVALTRCAEVLRTIQGRCAPGPACSVLGL